MKMRKFASRPKADRFAKAMHLKAVRVRAATLADGTKGAMYKFKRVGKRKMVGSKRKKRRR